MAVDAASSFSFCRASLEHTLSAEELSYQLPRRSGGSNLTWHDGRGQTTAHTRTVKLLQQPGTEGIQPPLETFLSSSLGPLGSLCPRPLPHKKKKNTLHEPWKSFCLEIGERRIKRTSRETPCQPVWWIVIQHRFSRPEDLRTNCSIVRRWEHDVVAN
ncbi:uncharacterized protein samd10b isoform X2 [Nerophis lumbriciformis]|uniref:uncharacterized protein samd10b isoform X2 n=1 Tax=Nerophis lumbriciformis TaxID=546530 RepID=UPI002ADF35D4|nr:uncharacterized protein LOC133619688 isoform X2 [Nerophis lumbriciformis]